MASPLISKGFLAKAVIAPESTYGTLPTSGHLAVALVSETLSRSPKILDNEVKNGLGAARPHSEQDTETVSGTITIEADYNNIEPFLKQAIGAVSGGTTSALTYSPSNEIEISHSLIIDKTVERWQFTGGVIEELRLISKAGSGKVMLETDWTFQQLVRSSDALPSATLTVVERMKHSHLTFLIGDIAGAIASTDALRTTDITLRIKNNLKTDEFADQSTLIMQPIRNNYREVSLEFTAPRYDNSDEIAALLTASANHTQMQSTLTWTGLIASGEAIIPVLAVSLPELFFDEQPNPNVSDASTLTFSAKLRAYLNAHNTSYMSGVTSDMMAVLTNSNNY